MKSINKNKSIVLPRRLRVDASTVCQLKCPSCPTASGTIGKQLGGGFLSLDHFKNIVDANPGVSHIELSSWGEIFLNKELIEIMKYAYKRNVRLSAENGANLNNVREDVLKALVEYKFGSVNCSIDGASQEVYAKYRVNGNLDNVLKNIKAINQWKKHYKSPYPILRWQYIAFGHNEHEIETARKLANEQNMEFTVKLSWEDLYTKEFSPVKNKELIKKETGLGVANRQEYRDRYKQEYYTRKICLELWHNPQVNYDGKVLGCCINHWGDYGNAFKDGLEPCVNGEKMKAARDMLMGKAASREDVPCARCDVYKDMKQYDGWITDQETVKRYVRSRRYIWMENKVLGPRLAKRVFSLWHEVRRRIDVVKLIIKRGGKIKHILSFLMPGIKGGGDFLTSHIHPLRVPLEPDMKTGWRFYPIFSGITTQMDDLSVHASVLMKDKMPHPPHQHKEEEILMMLNGEADLILPDHKTIQGKDRYRLKTGQFVYYPAHFPHTLQTVSESPANYLMFKWYAAPSELSRTLMFGHFDAMKSFISKNDEEFAANTLLEGTTECLAKLHSHTSVLASKAGYKPHIDQYDVAIVVLEGEIETLGLRVKPYNVVFYAAGEPHGVYNPTDQAARYLVFEFHGR